MPPILKLHSRSKPEAAAPPAVFVHTADARGHSMVLRLKLIARGGLQSLLHRTGVCAFGCHPWITDARGV